MAPGPAGEREWRWAGASRLSRASASCWKKPAGRSDAQGVTTLLLRSRGRVRLVQRLAQDARPLRGQRLGLGGVRDAPRQHHQVVVARLAPADDARKDLARLG